jgi:endonuclease/exonuclease/phosphatase family metal-dependent hydrolase
MKLANWNIEWMNDWFTPISAGPPGWRTANEGRGVSDVAALAARVAGVIRALGADVVTIQEGPSRKGEMQLFVDDHLDGAWEVFGPSGRGTQRLFALVRKGGAVEQARRVFPEPGRIDFGESWPVDVTGDLIVEGYEFTREPLELELTVAGRKVVLLNLHTKSKYIHGGRSLWDDPATRAQFIAQAVRNRRRIAAELMRVRTHLDELLTADPEARLVVMGDLNDGPGIDFFEQNYLIHNVVAVVSGSPFHPRHMLRHAFIDRELKDRNFTARFDDFVDDIRDRPLLLDHILLSPSLYWGALRNARIEHEAFEAQLVTGPTARMSRPSDHRPQSASLEF